MLCVRAKKKKIKSSKGCSSVVTFELIVNETAVRLCEANEMQFNAATADSTRKLDCRKRGRIECTKPIRG